MSDEREPDPYSLEENYLRTDGHDVCHWCALRPQEWIWGPYGTRTCGHCDEMAEQGRAADIVEETAARITVRDRWFAGIDPEEWRAHELERITRWIEVRTERRPLTAEGSS